MRALFLNRVYPPADGATGHVLANLAPELVRRGWEVTVVASGVAGSAPRSETVYGVRVERVSACGFTRRSHWKRALSYVTLYPTLLWRVLRLPRADIVVTMTDPPLLLLLGPILKWTKGCRLVHWAQDLYPEVAEELGVLRKGGWLASFCARLSTWAARRHDRIIAVGRCMKERWIARGLKEEIIRVVPNWAAASSSHDKGPPLPGPLLPRKEERENHAVANSANPFRREHCGDARFVVMYSGNLGLAHPFEAMLDAATQLNATRPDILFLIVGAGPRLPWVKQQVEERALSNVRQLPPQPADKLAESLGAADLHLVSMQENLCGLVVPSKLYGAMAAGRPCLFLGPRESEAARTLVEHGCGSVLDANDGAGLAHCIGEWSDDANRLRDAGRRAKQASAKFSASNAAEAFHQILLQAAHADAGLALQQTASRTQT